MTAERMRWYSEGLHTAVSTSGRVVAAAVNIHTDDEFARSRGLPGRLADGMISTNWLSALLVDAFGDGFLRGGALQTKFIRPIYENERVFAIVTVTSVDRDGDGAIVRTEVRCETDGGELCTIGTASARLPDPA
jgi:acyl dehydratase